MLDAQAKVEAPTESSMQEFIGRLDSLIEDSGSNNSRLRSFNDRLCGDSSDTEKSGESPCDGSVLGAISTKMGILRTFCNEQRQQLDRLETIG